MERHFETAPWSAMLKVGSAFATVLLVAATVMALRVASMEPGATGRAVLGAAAIGPAILAIALLFRVTGYTISPTELDVERPLWTTRIPLDELRRVLFDPGACKGSVRLFGNGGLFAFTGLFWNSRLGRYRLFATNLRYAVVLGIGARTIVISPASPQAFVETVRHFFPAT